MRKKVAVAAIATMVAAGLVTAVVGGAGAAAAAPKVLKASLTGTAEVPGPGDPDGHGRAVIVAVGTAKKVCFALRWQRLGSATAAHIHAGRAGVAGDIVVPLFAADGLSKNVRSIGGCTHGVKRSLIRAIKSHPGRYYVNVHTKGFPEGAIRGQLRAVTG
jgi:hypothetical protein